VGPGRVGPAAQAHQPDQAAQVTIDEDGERTLHLHVQDQSNVRVALRHPVTVRVPRGPVTVRSIELYADQPDALVQAARAHTTGVVPDPPSGERRLLGRQT
jgi:hypothetical protein